VVSGQEVPWGQGQWNDGAGGLARGNFGGQQAGLAQGCVFHFGGGHPNRIPSGRIRFFPLVGPRPGALPAARESGGPRQGGQAGQSRAHDPGSPTQLGGAGFRRREPMAAQGALPAGRGEQLSTGGAGKEGLQGQFKAWAWGSEAANARGSGQGNTSGEWAGDADWLPL